MNDLMEILYSYAQDYILRGILDREPEYANTAYCADRQERALRELLDEENKKHLDNLLDERKLMAFFEERAVFLSGLQVAVKLLTSQA